MPAASRDPATIVSVEQPLPPAARKWSWPELMRDAFGVEHLGLPIEASAPRPPPSDLFDWS
jgi:hypothetical protein